MTDDLLRRLDAVERAVTDGSTDLTGVADAAETADRVATVERRLDAVETRLDELDAATQAIRGYLGHVRERDANIERRANLAVAKAEAVEASVFDDDGLVVERLPDERATTETGSEMPGTTPHSAEREATPNSPKTEQNPDTYSFEMEPNSDTASFPVQSDSRTDADADRGIHDCSSDRGRDTATDSLQSLGRRLRNVL